MKRVSIAWSHMGKQEKLKYSQMALADKKRYERELQKWQNTHGKQDEEDEEEEEEDKQEVGQMLIQNQKEPA
jgi:predicted ribosome quality control (RQC) complex YloA/Tae2 family protein